jgi:hypothetical protein
LKVGVLGYGIPGGLLMVLALSYQRDAWLGPREVVGYLITWCAVGLVFGALQLAGMTWRDRTQRCSHCGEAVPNHTRWCVEAAGRRANDDWAVVR